jgi:plastocyanin
MLRRAAILSALLVLLTSATTSATEVVTINDSFTGFEPSATLATLGERVTWENDDGFLHSATGKAPLRLWSRDISPGGSASRVFNQAGAFPYLCRIHNNMTGIVRVPIVVTPATGTPTTTFTVRAGIAAPPAGFRYVIQRRAPGAGRFSAWKTIATATTTFRSSVRGVWRFRSQLRKVSNGAASNFSPVDSVTIG